MIVYVRTFFFFFCTYVILDSCPPRDETARSTLFATGRARARPFLTVSVCDNNIIRVERSYILYSIQYNVRPIAFSGTIVVVVLRRIIIIVAQYGGGKILF